jgi:hypothetical protein
MPAIADVAAQVVLAGVPVLFTDTCCLVDVIRAPLRPDQLKNCIEGAQELLGLLTSSPNRCLLVVASHVPTEWAAHAGGEADNLRNRLSQFDEEGKRYHEIAPLVGIVPGFPRPAYGTLPLADRLTELSRSLLDVAVRIDPDNDCKIRAADRAAAYIPPSRKGGEVKDSTIFEEYLAVCRLLRSAGFAGRKVFCTSNTKDYCETGIRPFPSLAIDYANVGLQFAANLPWAVNELKKP